ncbi:MAG: GIY-YIG nuclease family protein [Bacteroidetes bacterium]|nr:GIY-YIG nuclease family protein [Bacteroidota bacterium]
MKKGGAIYILANQNNTTLYTGVTSNLLRRMHEHKTGKYKYSFSNRYNVTKLVYYEIFTHIEDAIAREKQIKAGSRKKKEALINTMNPKWEDLSYSIGYED